jgi:hypothetical protein
MSSRRYAKARAAGALERRRQGFGAELSEAFGVTIPSAIDMDPGFFISKTPLGESGYSFSAEVAEGRQVFRISHPDGNTETLSFHLRLAPKLLGARLGLLRALAQTHATPRREGQ